MGRHAVGGGGRRPAGLSLPLVTVGLQLLAVVGIGIWWSSTQQGGMPGQGFVVAVVAVSVLALVATIALMISRRDSWRAVLPAGVTVGQLRAGSHRNPPVALAGGHRFVAGYPASGHQGGSVDPVDSPGGDRGAADGGGESESVDDANPDVTSRIAMARFPVMPPRPFRLSEIALHDDLFTHRAAETPDK